MGLFDKFRETVFVNDSTDLEKQIVELKRIRETAENKYYIDRDIKLLETGLQGEKEIIFELKNANIGMYVLHDITIAYEDLTAQIDFMIVTKAHIYLVECKNMIGDITVNNAGEFKRDYMLNGKKIKEAIYSPLTQAQRHKEVLKKTWLSRHKNITTYFLEKTFDKVYKPLVVLANSRSLLNTKFAPKEIKGSVIRVDQLISYIKDDISKFDKSLYSSSKEMLLCANTWLDSSIEKRTSFVDKYKVIDREVKIDVDRLRNALKDLRTTKSSTMKVPAYYVFTNDEMELLLQKLPKSIDELKSLNILSPIKIKCHGQEIVDLIKSSEIKNVETVQCEQNVE